MKAFFISLATLLTLAVVPAGVAYAGAVDPYQEVCQKGGNEAMQSEYCTNKARTTGENPVFGPNGIFIKVTNVVAIIAGIAAVIVIILAGLQYIMDGGDANKVSQARNTIIYAVIGLVIIVIARSIIAFVISKL